MVNNLLQKIMKGTYTSQELEEIEDAVKYAKQNYEVANNSVAAAQKNEEKRKKLEQIDANIVSLNNKINNSNKKQARCILGLMGFSIPALIALGVISAFDFPFFLTGSAVLIAAMAACCVPIGMLDFKRKKLLNEIKHEEEERSFLLSGLCFSVTPEYATNAYNDYKKSHSKVLTNTKEEDNSLNI